MTLPRSLQAQLEEADRIVATIEGGAQPGEPAPQPEPQPVPQPQPQPQPPPQPQVQDQSEETWKHKYDTLKGIFNAEKARLEGALDTLGGQVQNLTSENARLTAEMQVRRETPAAPAKKLTDADRETFGAELVDLIERAQGPAVDPDLLRQTLARIEQLEGQLGQVKTTQVESKKDLFWKGLSREVSNWEEINNSDDWKAWLIEVDPVYGEPRQAGLDRAFNKLDVDRVATIFRTFESMRQPPAPTPQQELQRQVTPSRSRASNEVPQQQGGMLWTNESIEAFYRDARRGLLTDEQKTAYEEDLNRAAAEGRIRG